MRLSKDHLNIPHDILFPQMNRKQLKQYIIEQNLASIEGQNVTVIMDGGKVGNTR